MLVSISCTGSNSSDLGFLLHKHPDRVRSVDVANGRAHVFYPEASHERTTATVLVEVDPILLSRRVRRDRSATLEPYVNDRPYVASSMLSTAIGRLFGTALSGTCDAKPELVDKPLNLSIAAPVVGAPHGGELIARLFEPLGWTVAYRILPLDVSFDGWGDSRYASISLSGAHTVRDALAHLYVLFPVLDGKKHYWIGDDEVDKLLRRGGDWLAVHPERELISRRYLRFGSYAREALARLTDDATDPDELDEGDAADEHALERPLSLSDQRLDAVMGAVTAAGGRSVVDIGCGEGRLLERLVAEPSVTSLLGVDVSVRALERAEARLGLDYMSERRRDKVVLAQSALTYTDERLRGRDVCTLIEVIEHLDPERLDVFARVVFGDVASQTVIVTTPNREYNVHFERLPHGQFRHRDHRFEWGRSEFGAWAESVCADYGYSVVFSGVGPDDAETGPPTQMAVFSRGAA